MNNKGVDQSALKTGVLALRQICPRTHFIVTLKFMYMSQFGQNLTIGSEDSVQTRLFHRVI